MFFFMLRFPDPSVGCSTSKVEVGGMHCECGAYVIGCVPVLSDETNNRRSGKDAARKGTKSAGMLRSPTDMHHHHIPCTCTCCDRRLTPAHGLGHTTTHLYIRTCCDLHHYTPYKSLTATQKELDLFVGFRAVMDKLSNHRKIVITHNGLYDICHMYHRFHDHLPGVLVSVRVVVSVCVSACATVWLCVPVCVTVYACV
jgi:hypothetical protein